MLLCCSPGDGHTDEDGIDSHSHVPVLVEALRDTKIELIGAGGFHCLAVAEVGLEPSCCPLVRNRLTCVPRRTASCGCGARTSRASWAWVTRVW